MSVLIVLIPVLISVSCGGLLENGGNMCDFPETLRSNLRSFENELGRDFCTVGFSSASTIKSPIRTLKSDQR